MVAAAPFCAFRTARVAATLSGFNPRRRGSAVRRTPLNRPYDHSTRATTCALCHTRVSQFALLVVRDMEISRADACACLLPTSVSSAALDLYPISCRLSRAQEWLVLLALACYAGRDVLLIYLTRQRHQPSRTGVMLESL